MIKKRLIILMTLLAIPVMGQNVNSNLNRKDGRTFNYSATRITTSTTNTITSSTAYVATLVIATTSAGTGWTVTVKNKEGTAKTLYTGTVAAGTIIPIAAGDPIISTGGIDIVTASGTPGTIDVFLTYLQ